MRIAIDQRTGYVYSFSISGEYPENGFFLTVISPSDTIIKNITLKFEPSEIQYSNPSYLYISSGKNLYRLNTDNYNISLLFSFNTTIYSFNVLPDNREVAVSLSNYIVILDPEDLVQIAKINTDSFASKIIAQNNTFFALLPVSKEIVMIKADNLRSYKFNLLGSYPVYDATISGSNILITTGSDAIIDFNTSTNKPEVIHLAGLISGSSIVNDRSLIFILDSSSIKEYSLGNYQLLSEEKLNYTASFISINPEKNLLYVSNYHQITVFSFSNPSNNDLFTPELIVLTILLIVSFLLFFLMRRAGGGIRTHETHKGHGLSFCTQGPRISPLCFRAYEPRLTPASKSTKFASVKLLDLI